MKRAGPSIALIASLALFVGWTQNTQSDWLKGIIYAGSGKIQLTDATGNLAPLGNVVVGGNESISGTLAVTGATTLRSTLAVSGNQTNSGNLGVNGTLGVTGAATLRSTLSVAGSSSFAAGSFSGVLTAPTGTFTGALTGTSATLSSTLSVTDQVSFADEFSLTDIANGLTAGTGGQGAVAVTGTISRFSTVAGSNDSTLPAAVAGLCVIIGNGHGTVALDVFPASGDVINKESANASIALAAGEAMFCCAADATNWVCIIGSAT